jgi:hypothetical protein
MHPNHSLLYGRRTYGQEPTPSLLLQKDTDRKRTTVRLARGLGRETPSNELVRGCDRWLMVVVVAIDIIVGQETPDLVPILCGLGPVNAIPVTNKPYYPTSLTGNHFFAEKVFGTCESYIVL